MDAEKCYSGPSVFFLRAGSTGLIPFAFSYFSEDEDGDVGRCMCDGVR